MVRGRTGRARWWVSAAAVVGVVLPAWVAAVVDVEWPRVAWMDLQVYRGAVDSLLSGGGLYDYSYPDPVGRPAPFLYPPFAALLLLPLALVPLPAAGVGWSLVQVYLAAGLVALLVRATGWRGTGPAARIGVPVLAVLGLLASRPVTQGLDLGQLSLLIATLCVVDLLVLPRRWRGVLVGLAAAIKLTPLFFVGYFLFTRQWRAAGVAVGSFLAATAIAFAVLPGESVRFWTDVVLRVDRVPNLGSPGNLSILGMLGAWRVPEAWQRPLWVVLAGAVAALGLWRARHHHRAGDDAAAVIVAGTAAALVGPAAWVHHVVWLPLAALVLALAERRSSSVVGWVLLASCFAASPLWAGPDPTLVERVLGTVPVVLMLAVCTLGLPGRSEAAGWPGERRGGESDEGVPLTPLVT